jgi:ATP-dependent DNA helicase RecQ
VRGFDRPNLTYEVERVRGIDDKTTRMIELARTRDGGVALVYAATRKHAEKYGDALKRAGMRVRVYHAGLDDGPATRPRTRSWPASSTRWSRPTRSGWASTRPTSAW